MLAVGVPSSFLSTMVPAVAVYLISWPPIRVVCSVFEDFSSSGPAGRRRLGAAAAGGGIGRWRSFGTPLPLGANHGHGENKGVNQFLSHGYYQRNTPVTAVTD